jgi:hypothetical protein
MKKSTCSAGCGAATGRHGQPMNERQRVGGSLKISKVASISGAAAPTLNYLYRTRDFSLFQKIQLGKSPSH